MSLTDLAPKKQCPKCESTVHANRRGCLCGYQFKNTEPTPVTNVNNYENNIQGTVNNCLPEGYSYSGKLNLPGTNLHVAYTEKQERFKANSLRELTGFCWKHSTGKASKKDIASFTL